MNDIAENIRLMKTQIEALNSEIEIEKLKYLEKLRDKSIPIMQRWQLFIEHPDYTGKTVNYFDELDSILLKVIIEEHSLSIDVFGLDVCVTFKKILMETIINEKGEINKNELKELGGFTEKDFNHKLSTELSKKYSAIFVGNVNSSGLVKTKMAKSVLDAGWSQFKTMLMYKCEHTGAWYEEVNEAFSTQVCSTCGTRCGPRGLKELGIREWTCSHCNTVHHRDINAAKNILACGHARLVAGIPLL